MLVSAVQQWESVVTIYIYIYIYTHTHIHISVCIYIPSLLSLPPAACPQLSPDSGCHGAPRWAPCVLWQLPTVLSCVLGHVWLSEAPWAVTAQARTVEGSPFPPPGVFPTRGLNPCLWHLLHWQVGSSPVMPPTRQLFYTGSVSMSHYNLDSHFHHEYCSWALFHSYISWEKVYLSF